MPLLTPSRFIVLAISLSLLTFLWTYGMPREVGEPLPVVHHEPLAQKPEVSVGKSAVKTLTMTMIKTETSATVAVTMTGEKESSPTSTSGEKGSGTPDEQKEDKHTSTSTTPTIPYPTGHNTTSPPHTNSTTEKLSSCKSAPGASSILLILSSKFTHLSHLSTHLTTLLTCAPNYTLYSPHTHLLPNHTIHNPLTHISAPTKSAYDEFKTYEKARAHPDLNLQLPPELDRWTMLPTIYDAYKKNPEMRFYLLAPPTATLLWANLLTWTSRLDPRIPYYIGAPLSLGDTTFAQAAAGILLSNAAMQAFAKAYDELYTSEWEPRIANSCCGDVVLATAMRDARVEFSAAWPMLQTLPLSQIAWNQKIWCSPAVSFGGVSVGGIEELWGFEGNFTAKYGWGKEILARDVFNGVLKNRLMDKASEWDNDSSDIAIVKPSSDLQDLGDGGSREWWAHSDDVRKGVTGWEACKAVCEAEAACVQWRFSKQGEGQCHLGNSVKLGRARGKKEGEEGWISGWLGERIEKVMRGWECKDVKWGFGQF